MSLILYYLCIIHISHIRNCDLFITRIFNRYIPSWLNKQESSLIVTIVSFYSSKFFFYS